MDLQETLEKIVEMAREELHIVRKRAEEKTPARDHGKDYHEAQAAADRQAFRVKGAKVIEQIINVKLDAQMRALSEDIEKAKQNDFGSRIFEAFMGEARRLFFNSHKELRGAMKAISEQRHAVYLIDYRLGERTGLELIRQGFSRRPLAPVLIDRKSVV